MQQQYTQIGNDSCTTSNDFYIGGSARCQLGDRGMHLAEKCDQDTLAIPCCHFQPEIRFRYQVTRKPPQNARSESGYGGVGLLLFQPGHKMAQIVSGLQSWKRLFQLKSPYTQDLEEPGSPIRTNQGLLMIG